MKINCTKLFGWLPIQSNFDKVCHIVAGFITSVIGVFLFGGLGGLILGVSVAVGKELYDKYSTNGSGFDFFDLFATLLGVFFGLIVGLEILKLI